MAEYSEATLAAFRVRQLGETFELPGPLALRASPAPPFTHAKVVSRTTVSARVLLSWQSTTQCDLQALPKEYEARWHGCVQDVVASALLRLLNSLWSDAGVSVGGSPVAARACNTQQLGAGACISAVAPTCASLYELKRRFTKGDKSERVADFLDYQPRKLLRLASTTAAYLASSYLLGVAAGDGDDLLLTSEGELYRLDFGCLFGSGRERVAGTPVESSLVWLPRAITAALGDQWPEVQQAALLAFRIAALMFAPSPPPDSRRFSAWFKTQSALLWLESALSLPITRFVSGLAEAEFSAVLQRADCNLSKKFTNFLHDNFGVRNKLLLHRSAAPDLHLQGSRRCIPEHWFDEGEPGVDRLVWALGVDALYLATCVLVCLCQRPESCKRLLRKLLCKYFLLAAHGGDADVLSNVSRLVVNMVQHYSGNVQFWLGRALALDTHRHCLVSIATTLFDCGATWDEPSEFGDVAMLDGSSSLEFGAVCAIARLVLSADLERMQPVMWRDVAPAADCEREIVRHSAIRTVILLLKAENCVFNDLLTALVGGLAGEKMALAARDMPADERFDVVRTVERLAKDAGCSSEVRAWARRCLITWAQDHDQDVNRAAVCAIACAVEHDCCEVRLWARSFLSAAAWGMDMRSPLYALARMASDQETPDMICVEDAYIMTCL